MLLASVTGQSQWDSDRVLPHWTEPRAATSDAGTLYRLATNNEAALRFRTAGRGVRHGAGVGADAVH